MTAPGPVVFARVLACVSLVVVSLFVSSPAVGENLSSLVTVTKSERSLTDLRTRLVTTTATLTIVNSSTQSIALPIHGVFDISSTEVTVLDAIAPGAGNPYDKYYVDLSTKVSGGSLKPGVSISTTVKLVCKSTVRYSYKFLTFGSILSLETTPPQVTISTPVNGQVTTAANVQVSGTVDDPDASLTVGGLPVVISNKAFTVVYPLQEDANTIVAKAVDKAGNEGSATVQVTRDSQSPVATLAAPASAAAGSDVTISLSAADNHSLALVEVVADGALVWSDSPPGKETGGKTISLRLSPTLTAGTAVAVKARALDSAGNMGRAATTITISKRAEGPGWLNGKVLDDTRGLALEGAVVTITDAAGEIHPLTTSTEGAWALQLPCGVADIVAAKEGFTGVRRTVSVRPDQRTGVQDCRLTRVSAIAHIMNTGGGAVRLPLASGMNPPTLEAVFPVTALSTAVDVRLTPVSNQGLAASLPPGWSPLVALDMRLLSPGTGAIFEQNPLAAAVTLTLPLPKGLGAAPLTAYLVRYDTTRRSWLSVGTVAIPAAAVTVTVTGSEPGQYALLLADPAPLTPTAPGEEPAAASLIATDFAQTTVVGRVVPQAALPSIGLRTAGDLLLTAKADASTALSLVSGLLVTARITEIFDLNSGSVLQPAAVTQDIVLYRYPCATAISGGATEPFSPDVALRTTFPVSPSRDFTIIDLLKGKVSVVITPPDTTGGVTVGAEGARLVQPDGTALTIPVGAVTGSIPVSVATVPFSSLSGLVGSDFRLLRGVDIVITGQALKSSATLAIPAPVGFNPALPVVVARKFDVTGGSRLKLVATGKVTGSLISSEPLPLELTNSINTINTINSMNSINSINSSGQYLFLQAVAPIGYLTGTVSDATSSPFNGIQVTSQGATLADRTGSDGRYLLALAAGAHAITALDPARGDTATASAAITSKTKTILDLTVSMTPPRIIAISPVNGALNVQPIDPVVVTFSKAMDKNSVTETTFTVTDPANTALPGVITWNAEATTATYYPRAAFAQETVFTLTITATVKDLQGYPLGRNVVSTFTIRRTTAPAMPPAGSITGAFPDADGFIAITGTQGSADPGATVLLINDTTGEVTGSKSQTNGSFSGKVRGQVGDEIKVVLMDASGNQTTISDLTFKSQDGSYLVSRKGGTVAGEGGSILDIPEGALIGPAILKVTALPEANLPNPLPEQGKYLGAVNIDTGGINFQKEVHLSIPVPVGFDPKTPVFVTRPRTIYHADDTMEQVYEIIDSTKIVNGRITTASPPFEGIIGFGSYIFTGFPTLDIGIISGYAYQEMNDLPGYQAAPEGVMENPGKDATGNPVYRYDRPVPGAVIRTPAAWNFVSVTNSKGHYAGFTTLHMDVGVSYTVTAIHPQTMQRETKTGYLTSVDQASRNIISNLNFKLAEKDTVVPDKAAPIITIDMQVAPASAPDTRIIAGTVPVGTVLQVPVTILDQQMGSATMTVTFTDQMLTETFQALLGQSGLPTLFTPQTGAKPAMWRYDFVTEFQSLIAAPNPVNFRPNRVGIYSFVVDATDSAGNRSRQSMQLRAVSAETSLGENKDGPPTVDSLTPSDRAKDVMVSIPITAVFSEPVSNVTSDTFRLIDLTAGAEPGVAAEIIVPATVTTGIVNGRMQAVLTPRGNLHYDRDYQVVLTSGIKDLPDKNDSATTADKRFPLVEVRSAFSTKKPTSYDLADNQFSGRDIDLYYNRETMKLYSYVTAGGQGWRVVEVTDPTNPQVVWPRPDLGIPSGDFRFAAGFDYRSVAVHPDPDKALMAMTDTVNFTDGNQYGYIRFYSLLNPALPEFVGREKLAEAYSGVPGRIALYDNYAFVATTNAGLQVVDITQARANQTDHNSSDGSSIVGVFDSVGQGLGQPNDVLVLNGVNALLTTTSGSLVTLDITEPSYPQLVTSIGQNDGRRFTRIAAALQYQYVDANNIPQNMDLVIAGSQEGKIRTIDMTNPTRPLVLASALDETGVADAVVTTLDLVIDKDSGLAFATSLGTVYVIDIKDPYKPKVINSFTSLYDPTGAKDATGALNTIPLGQMPAIIVRGGWIYAANQQNGLKILNFDPPLIKPDPGRYFVLLDENNKAMRDYQFTYKIQTDPGTNGDFENMRVVIFKDNEEIQRFTDALPDNPLKLIATGRSFDLKSSYQARVIVYDRLTKNDISSPEIPIVVGKFAISAEDDKYLNLKGATTDGTALLTLKLSVSPNYKIYKPVFSLEDPDLGIDTNATGLMLYQGGLTGAFVAKFDVATQSFKATYRVPQTYVRYDTIMEEADKTGAERVVKVNLGVTDIKPEIKLRRPPVVLVHGLWASPESWDTFESGLNNNNQYLVQRADYGTTNADAISKNYGVVKKHVDIAIGKLTAEGFYAPKVNVIGHSMGGLLTKEYCRINRSECKDKVNKYISINTPHKGSELAQLVSNINHDKPYFCYNMVLTEVDKQKGVWTDTNRTQLKGALLDLMPGSQALANLEASIMPLNWTAIAGVAESSKIYDKALSDLWLGLQLICGKKPDSTFSNILPLQQDTVFNISNDRIVSLTSQNGDAPSTFKIFGVDHSSVLKNRGSIDKVRDIIEN